MSAISELVAPQLPQFTLTRLLTLLLLILAAAAERVGADCAQWLNRRRPILAHIGLSMMVHIYDAIREVTDPLVWPTVITKRYNLVPTDAPRRWK